MKGRLPLVGLNIVPAESYRAAAGPLFAEGIVDALEWDVDDTFGFDSSEEWSLPPWVEAVLDVYAADDALYGHAVWLSLLTVRWDERQATWLEKLARECARRKYRHVSDHFGFMTAGNMTRGPMLPLPFTPAAVRIGHERLRQLGEAAGVPIGLETLASALSPADAIDQGPFLEALLTPSDGFIVFDVHNLWTQSYNLGLDPAALIATYPLERVREVHISGGAWWPTEVDAHKGPFRLDSHDHAVADEAMALLPLVLPRCPNLEVVIMENRGAGIETPEEQTRYRQDFLRLREAVEALYA